MALTEEEHQKITAAVLEIGAAINDRVNATTQQEKLAAQQRFHKAMREYTYGLLNAVKFGLSGDYGSPP